MVLLNSWSIVSTGKAMIVQSHGSLAITLMPAMTPLWSTGARLTLPINPYPTNNPLVQERLEHVRSARQAGVQRCICPVGQPYQLADGAQLVTFPLTIQQLKSRATKGLGVLQVWQLTLAGRSTNTWYEALFTRCPRDRNPPYPNHRVRLSDGDTVNVDFTKCHSYRHRPLPASPYLLLPFWHHRAVAKASQHFYASSPSQGLSRAILLRYPVAWGQAPI